MRGVTVGVREKALIVKEWVTDQQRHTDKKWF